MNTNLLLSQQKNILQNSLTKEEILIKSLIEEIYEAEQKISEINNNKNNNIQNGFYINSQKILELKDLKQRFNDRINSLNDKFQSEFNSKNEEIFSFKKKLNDLDLALNDHKEKIDKINLNEVKLPLVKYIFEKNINNKILTEEEIKEIYIKNKNSDELEKDKIKELNREIEIYKASESVILNNQKIFKENLDKLNENLKMLKEEKNSINNELFDIISYKESLECINKNNLIILNQALNKSNNNIIINNNIDINNFEETIEPIELFNYELSIIDLNKVPNILYNELSNSLGFALIDIHEKKEINKISNKSRIYIPKSQTKEVHTIEIYDKKKINYKENSFDINNKNKSLSNSCIIYDNKSLEKNSFEISIETEINSFIKSKKEFNANELLNRLGIIIIEAIKKNWKEIPGGLGSKIGLYLTYFFKILYYDKIIKDKIKFVNKEYKASKKEYKKAKEFANNELIKLDNKYKEIITKKSESENNLNVIKNSKINNNDNMTLSETEQSYVQLCSNINSIVKQKDEIKKNIILCENDINNKKIQKNNEIDNINNEIQKIEKEINDINNTNELNTLKNNESIINYRKIIAEKFNIIREQLQLYKQKYGTNISLYNKFINNINNSIQKTRNRIFINGAEDIFDNKFLILSTSQINTNISNKKIYKNNSFNKSSNNKINDMSELELSKNWSKILNKTTSDMKQTSTPSNYNFASNDLIFNYGNKNYNFINNIKIEKTNYSFNKYASKTISNNNEKRRKKIIATKKKSNSRLGNDFELISKNEFNINNFLSKKEENSKTFSHSFFRKQKKVGWGSTQTNKKLSKAKTNIGILNINLLKNKIPISNTKGIPKGNLNNSKIGKLLPLTKITFCYFRELTQQKSNIKKYNPLLNITSKELCKYPYNFIKSTISLSKNYQKIKIVPSSQLEPIDFDIISIENTVVSTGIKSIIDICRNYFKWKMNQDENNLDVFINEQINKYNNLSKEDIEKCINNKNFNFSLILKENNKKYEFIICSYDEFKMWINGMAYIIKNKDEIFKVIN